MGTEALSLEDVSIRLGQTRILNAITLDVAPGSFTCLLGPSGCGKTTLLRSIAGFTPLSSGDIRIGTTSIAALPPEKRQTAMVFQSYALWPHMNVGANLAYPLKLRGVERSERDRRVAEILELLDLPGYADRAVASLSGGQRQRVALGRALIIDPPILLLDEPLSNLDAAIRRNLRSELRRLQQRLGITTIMVTHDQEEALSMADRIVLMRQGEIVQVAAPETLYGEPADLAAARFLGVDNVVSARPGDPRADLGAAQIGFRSQDARVDAPVDGPALVRHGTVQDCAYTGGAYQIAALADEDVLSAVSHRPVSPGTPITVSVPETALIAFGADTLHIPATRH